MKTQKAYTTEQGLWQAFRAGDRNAFAQLFHTYSDAMYAYGKKITADSELVKDTIQDVFVKLHNNRANLGETQSVKGYLLVALKRTLINHFHVSSATLLSIDEMNARDETSDLRFEIELSAQDASDADLDTDEERRAQLTAALQELTPRQREAIYLYYIQEIPLNEISVLLEMNYQSTRNLLHRAMLKLRQHITSSSLSMSALLLQYLSL